MFNEESLELMTIDLLKEQGYSYESGESIGRDYSEVILEYVLTLNLTSINSCSAVTSGNPLSTFTTNTCL